MHTGCWWVNLKETTHLEAPVVDIGKIVVKKWDGRILSGFLWHTIKTSRGLLYTR